MAAHNNNSASCVVVVAKGDDVLLACVGKPSECHTVGKVFPFCRPKHVTGKLYTIPFLDTIRKRLSEHVASYYPNRVALHVLFARPITEEKPH